MYKTDTRKLEQMGDFSLLDFGEVITHSGEKLTRKGEVEPFVQKGVYAGKVMDISCMCGGNISEVPVILYLNQDDSIDIEKIISLTSKDQAIINHRSIIETLTQEDKGYLALREELEERL